MITSTLTHAPHPPPRTPHPPPSTPHPSPSFQIDSSEVITEPEHTAAAKGLGLLQARTSAKTGKGVTDAFNELVIAVYDKDKATVSDVTGVKREVHGPSHRTLFDMSSTTPSSGQV